MHASLQDENVSKVNDDCKKKKKVNDDCVFYLQIV